MNIIFVQLFFALAVMKVAICHPEKNNSCVCGAGRNQKQMGDENKELLNQYPWTAAVYISVYRCSGALISNKHILVSGHCGSRLQMLRDSGEHIEVRLGDNMFNTVTRGIFAIHTHENYNDGKEYNIAVLQLDQVVSGYGVQPICLPESASTNFSGKLAVVTGWYDEPKYKSEFPEDLQESANILKSNKPRVPIWTNEKCAEIPDYEKRLTNNMICAGEYENRVRWPCIPKLNIDLIAVERDDGRMELAGLYAFGTRCGSVGVPGVYTRVANFLPWIHDQMKAKVSKQKCII